MAENARAYERVLEYVEGEIAAGRLKRGQKLPPERELAEQLGIGRNSVREALRTLAHMGFLSCSQGAGNFLSCDFQTSLRESINLLFLLGEADYRQVSELRQGIETRAALLAADRMRPEQLERLEQIVRQMRRGDEEKNVLLDKELHDLIAQAAQNELILQILSALSDSIDRFISDLRRRITVTPESRERLQLAHEAIVQGLRLRDRKLLTRALEDHFRIVDENITNQ